MSRDIAIVGKMYSGKTTLANELVKSHGYTRVAMAGPLKKLAEYAYGEIVEKDKEYATTDRDSGAMEFKSGRRLYQEIGQSMKWVDRDIWLRIFVNDTNNMNTPPYVVDDVRFGFEADYLREQGWAIVKVSVSDDIRVQRATNATGRAPTAEELMHESEAEVDDIEVDFEWGGSAHMSEIADRARFLSGMI